MEKDFEKEVLERLTKIETKLDDYNGIKAKSEDGYTLSKVNQKDIQELQDKIKWISRTCIGAILTGAISLIYALIKTRI